jgi:hypothetical protein
VEEVGEEGREQIGIDSGQENGQTRAIGAFEQQPAISRRRADGRKEIRMRQRCRKRKEVGRFIGGGLERGFGEWRGLERARMKAQGAANHRLRIAIKERTGGDAEVERNGAFLCAGLTPGVELGFEFEQIGWKRSDHL